MEKTLRRRQGSRRLLVQYVPHAFGYKAMNLWLIHWLYRARRRERIWAMFHEVCFPRYWGQPLQHVFLGTVQRWMAREIARTARRRFVTTPRWRTLLHSFGHLAGTTEWLPVPSNVTTEANATVAREIRARFCPAGGQLLGHFGTFSNIVTLALTPPLIATLRNDFRRAALLLGRGGQEYARQLCQDHPDLSHRIWATGELDATALADHLSACDLLLQPYHDGASARRGSLMASAALGLPIISSRDPTTESVWEEYDAVCLVENTPTTWLKAIENLLADPTRRETLGRNVWRLYQDCFAIERTVDVLRSRHREDDRRKE
jgi:glycosyltransferase involved in cell wall biosynthesis